MKIKCSLSPVHWKVQVEPQFRLCRRERDISGKGTASPAQRSKNIQYSIFNILQLKDLKNIQSGHFSPWVLLRLRNKMYQSVILPDGSWRRFLTFSSSWAAACSQSSAGRAPYLRRGHLFQFVNYIFPWCILLVCVSLYWGCWLLFNLCSDNDSDDALFSAA